MTSATSGGHSKRASGPKPEERSIETSWFDAIFPRAGARLRSRRLLNLVVWLLAAAAAIVNATTMPALYESFVPLTLVASVLHAVSLPMALNRPPAALVLSTIATGGTVFLTAARGAELPWPIPVTSLVILALLCAILALRQRWPYPVAAGLLAVVVAGLCAMMASPLQDERPAIIPNLLTAASVLALVIIFGELVRGWLASRAELLEQHERAATETQRRQLIEERNRIARELHDVVAHSLSIISIQASTARYRIDGVGPQVAAELDEITEAARTALGEMRGLLAVLRQEDGEQDLTPQPTLGRIPDLVRDARRRGARVGLRVEGRLDDSRVSKAVAIGTYRIVQEALSNAMRHAPGAQVDVRITVGTDALVLHVQNPPGSQRHQEVTRPDHVPLPGGFGLLGMRERVAFAGGTMHAGPREAGGFAVHVELPLPPEPPEG